MSKKKRRAAVAVESVERRDWSVADPAFAEWLGMSHVSGSGVTESSALGVTGFYRAVSLIAGTIAGLPLRAYERLDDDGARRDPRRRHAHRLERRGRVRGLSAGREPG